MLTYGMSQPGLLLLTLDYVNLEPFMLPQSLS